MSGLEDRILTLVKELEEEKRLADKRTKQLYLAGASFISHGDTPATYAAQAGKFVKVNATPDALLFANLVAGDLPAHSHAWADVSKTGSNLTDMATRQHAGLSDAPADAHHPQSHTLASHSTKAHSELTDVTSDLHHPQSHTLVSHTARDHHNLVGLGDDDHSQYYNSARHTKAIHTTLGLMPYSGGTFTGHVYAADHGTAATDRIVNVCYGTGSPPTASTTTIGTIFLKY